MDGHRSGTPEYRTRLIGLLDQDEAAVAKAIAASIYSEVLHTLTRLTGYDQSEMVDPFEAYHIELKNSNRDCKTVLRYWEVVNSFRRWLGGRLPDVANAKQFLASLRDRGYRPASVLLYYHALRLFFDFIGQPLKLSLGAKELYRRTTIGATSKA
jgi:hypothetical protein